MGILVDIRPYERADRERFLSLYETVWGRPKSGNWFDWRFDSNPYSNGVQMIVAEADGELIGAEPLLPFRLRTGSTTVDIYQPVDWIVHGEFRRQGVFTQMTELLFETYDDAALMFNFPSEVLLPGLKKFGWRVVGDVPMRYRIQRPYRLTYGNGNSRVLTDALASSALVLSGPAVMVTLGLLDRTAPSTPGLTVSRHTQVPVETLSRLYESATPEQFHLARDEAYLRWRFANPNWETATYVASRAGTAEASIVVATEQVNGMRCVILLDVQPMVPRDDRGESFRAALARLLKDYSDADIVKAPAGPYSDFLRRYGFCADTTFPLSRVSTTSTQVVRPLDDTAQTDGGVPDEEWTLGGKNLQDPTNWLLMPADLDIE